MTGNQRNSRRQRDERGEVTSTTVIVPLVLLSVMVVVQFGLAYHVKNVLAGAAQDGAAAAARVDASAADGATVAETLVNESASPLLADHTISAAVAGDRVVVTIEASVVSLIPFIDGIAVTAVGSAPIEQFHPQGS